MSGGSYNYLCYKDSHEIHNNIGDLNDMRDRLIDLGYLDAAKETESIILMLNAFEVRLQARIDKLNKVWQAVEWYDSNDFGEDEIKKEIERYRHI